MATYIHEKTKAFKKLGDPTDLPIRQRSESRIKNYVSATDARAWGHHTQENKDYIIDLISADLPKNLQVGKFVPVEVLINTLMGHKNAEIANLKRINKDYENFISKLKLSPEEEAEFYKIKSSLGAGDLDEVSQKISEHKPRNRTTSEGRDEKPTTSKIKDRPASDSRVSLKERNILKNVETQEIFKEKDNIDAIKVEKTCSNIKAESFKEEMEKTSMDSNIKNESLDTTIQKTPTRSGIPTRVIKTGSTSKISMGKKDDSQKKIKIAFSRQGMGSSSAVSVSKDLDPKNKFSKTSQNIPKVSTSGIEAGLTSEHEIIGTVKNLAEAEVTAKPVISDKSAETSQRFADSEDCEQHKEIARRAVQELETIQEIIKERDDLKIKLASSESELRQIKEKASCQKDIDSLEKQISKLQESSPEMKVVNQELQLLKKYCQKLGYIKNENRLLKMENNNLKKLNQKEECQCSGKSQEEDNSREGKFKQLMKELNKKVDKLKTVSEERNMLRKSVTRLENELSKYEDISCAVEEFKKRSKKLDTVLEDREDLQRRLDNISCLQGELKVLKEKADRADKLQKLLDESNAKMEKCKRPVEEVGKTLIGTNDLERYKRIEKEAEVLRIERDKLKLRLGELSAMEKDHKSLQAKCRLLDVVQNERDVYRTKSQELAAIQDDYFHLKSQVEEAKSLAKERDCLMRRVKELECIITDQDAEINRIVTHVDRLSCNQDKQQDRTKHVVSELRLELDQKDRLIVESELRLACVQEQLKDTIGKLNKESSSWKERLSAIDMSKNEATEKLSITKERLTEMQNSLLKEKEYSNSIKLLLKEKDQIISQLQRELQRVLLENARLQEIAQRMDDLTDAGKIDNMKKAQATSSAFGIFNACDPSCGMRKLSPKAFKSAQTTNQNASFNTSPKSCLSAAAVDNQNTRINTRKCRCNTESVTCACSYNQTESSESSDNFSQTEELKICSSMQTICHCSSDFTQTDSIPAPDVTDRQAEIDIGCLERKNDELCSHLEEKEMELSERKLERDSALMENQIIKQHMKKIQDDANERICQLSFDVQKNQEEKAIIIAEKTDDSKELEELRGRLAYLEDKLKDCQEELQLLKSSTNPDQSLLDEINKLKAKYKDCDDIRKMLEEYKEKLAECLQNRDTETSPELMGPTDCEEIRKAMKECRIKNEDLNDQIKVLKTEKEDFNRKSMEQEKLLENLKDVKMDNEKLKVNFESCRRQSKQEAIDLEKQLADCRKENESMRKVLQDMDNLKNQLANALKENKVLQKKIEDYGIPEPMDCTEYFKQLEDCRNHSKVLENSLIGLSKDTDCSEILKQLDEAKKKIGILEKEITNAQPKNYSDLQQEIDNFQKQNEELKSKMAEMRSKSDYDNLLKKLDDCMKENEESKNKSLKSAEDCENLKKQLNDCQSQMQELKDKVKQMDNLTKELNTSKDKLMTMKSLDDYENLQKQLNDCKQKHQELSDKMLQMKTADEYNKLLKQLDDTKSETRKTQDDYNNLLKQLEDCKKQANDLRDHLSSIPPIDSSDYIRKLENCNKEIDTLKKENENLKKELQDCKDRLSTALGAQAELDNVRKQLNDSQKDLEDCRKQLADYKTQLDNCKKELQNCVEELNNCRKELDPSKFDDLKRQLEQSQKELQAAKGALPPPQVATLNEIPAMSASDYEKFLKQTDDLENCRKQLDALKDQLKQCQDEKQATERNLKMLTEPTGDDAEKDRLLTMIKDLEENLKNMADQKTGGADDLDELRKRLEEEKEKNAKLEKALETNDVSGLYKDSKQRLAETESKLNAVNGERNVMERKLKTLDDQLTKTKKASIEAIKAANDNYKRDVKSLRGQYSDGVKKMQKSHEEIVDQVQKQHEAEIQSLKDSFKEEIISCTCKRQPKKLQTQLTQTYNEPVGLLQMILQSGLESLTYEDLRQLHQKVGEASAKFMGGTRRSSNISDLPPGSDNYKRRQQLAQSQVAKLQLEVAVERQRLENLKRTLEIERAANATGYLPMS